jgi:hypothetical protein
MFGVIQWYSYPGLNIFMGNFYIRILISGQAPMTHTYIPIYSRGRNLEDRNSRPAQTNNLRETILKRLYR